MLDHNVTARMALRHLYDLGHRRIAFMKGQRYSQDSESRWQSIVAIAQELGVIVRPELCIFLEENLWSPKLGYPPVRDLLSRTRDFTALFCFNDTSAIGAIRAGAYDFVQKPIKIETLQLTVERALRHHGLTAEVKRQREAVLPPAFEGIVG